MIKLKSMIKEEIQNEIVQENKYNLQIGDVIEFVNMRNYKVILVIDRIEEKSVYTHHRDNYDSGSARISWNTINGFIEKKNGILDSKIIRKNKE